MSAITDKWFNVIIISCSDLYGIFDQSDTVSDVLQCKAFDVVYFRYDTSYYRRPHYGTFPYPDKVDPYMEEIKCTTVKVKFQTMRI